jgi:hypothetical protein
MLATAGTLRTRSLAAVAVDALAVEAVVVVAWRAAWLPCVGLVSDALERALVAAATAT